MKSKSKKRLKDGSKHLLAYINKDKNHCSWDYCFFLGTIEAKLHDMEDFFSKEENCHLMNWQRTYKHIKWTRAILKIAFDDSFELSENQAFNTKNLDKDLKESLQHLESVKDKFGINVYKWHLGEFYQDKALRLAMRLIGRYCRYWWD